MHAGYAIGQEVVEKKIASQAQNILIEFDLIDHIELFNSNEVSSIEVRAEGSVQMPGFKLEEIDGHVILSDHEIPALEEPMSEEKACIIEPNYTSYRIYIPKERTVYVSFLEGNFYADSFDGELNLKAENGLVKLKNIQDPVHISLNTGSVFIRDIQDTKIDSATNMGILVDDIVPKKGNKPNRELMYTLGNPDKSIVIRTILANIYLYGSRD